MLEYLINKCKICTAKKVPPLAEGQVAAKKYLEWEEGKTTGNGREAPFDLNVSLKQISGNKGGIWLFPPKPFKEGTAVKNFCMRLKSCFLIMDDWGKTEIQSKVINPAICTRV